MIFSALLNSSLLSFLFFRTHSAEVRMCLFEIKDPLQRSKLVPSGLEPIGFDGVNSLKEGFKSCKMRPTPVKKPTNRIQKGVHFKYISGHFRLFVVVVVQRKSRYLVFKSLPQFVEHKNLPRILIMLYYISFMNPVIR